MKKIILLILIIPSIGWAQKYDSASINARAKKLMDDAQNASYEKYKKIDDRFGYKNISFDMTESQFLKEIKNKKSFTKERGINAYKITDNTLLSIGDVVIDSLIIQFFAGKILTLYFFTHGDVNDASFLSTLTESFGTPFKDNQFIERYSWLGRKVTGIYEQGAILKFASFLMSNKKTSEEYMAFYAEKTKDNSAKF